MKTLEKIRIWGDTHNPKWLAFFRIALGIVLLWKGIEFILNLDVLASFIRQSGLSYQIGTSVLINTLAQLIIAMHLIGGVCISLGIRTRLLCLLNLPALIGAVFFVNLHENMFRPYAEFWLSAIVLLALTCFLVEGNGELAIEHDTPETA